MKTKDFTSNVAHNLRGVHFFSPGACVGCDDCGLAPTECTACEGNGWSYEDDSETFKTYCQPCNGTGKIEPSEHDRECADEGGFSWQGCDSCGSPLGGTLYPAHGIIAETMEAAQSKDREISHFSICTDCVMYHANGDLPENCED